MDKLLGRLILIILIAIAILASLSGIILVQRFVHDDPDVVVVEMTSRQWEFSEKEILVKKGQTVIIRITSLDVPHGFSIEDLRVTAFTPPGETIEIRFTANKEGEFPYFCNVFCGEGHSTHRGKLIVEP